jgi:hypothetical protein
MRRRGRALWSQEEVTRPPTQALREGTAGASARAHLDYGGRVSLHTSPGRWVSVVAVGIALPACIFPPKSPASALPEPASALPEHPSGALGCEHPPEHFSHYAAPDGVPTVPLAVHLPVDLSGWFVLDRVCVDLDGARLFTVVRSAGNREAHPQFDWATRITPGEHTIAVTGIMEGGLVFHFVVKSSHRLAAENENGVSVAARIYELNPSPQERRPIMSWLETPIP